MGFQTDCRCCSRAVQDVVIREEEVRNVVVLGCEVVAQGVVDLVLVDFELEDGCSVAFLS